MNWRPVNELPYGKWYKPGKLAELQEQFLNSSNAMIEITFDKGEYVSATSCASAIITSVRRMGNTDKIQVHCLKGKVFMVKKE